MSTHEPPPRPTKGWARTHESLLVPRELHLGAVGDCRKCGPYSGEGDDQSSPVAEVDSKVCAYC